MRKCTWPTEELSFIDKWLLRLRLSWNKALLIRKGYSSVPILVANKLLLIDNACKRAHLPDNKADFFDADPAANKPSCDKKTPVGCSIN